MKITNLTPTDTLAAEYDKVAGRGRGNAARRREVIACLPYGLWVAYQAATAERTSRGLPTLSLRAYALNWDAS